MEPNLSHRGVTLRLPVVPDSADWARAVSSFVTRRRLRGSRRRALATLLPGVIALSLTMLSATVPVLAAATCASSGPSSYTVTVCISAPTSGASVTGNVAVAADVTITGASPGIQRVEFSLDSAYLLTDFAAPFSFQLPSANWVDGSHQLAGHALLRNGFTSSNVTITLTFVNGVSSPPPLPTGFAPRSVGGSHPVVAAVGDGPDGAPDAQAVGTMMGSWNPDMMLYLGDVYETGSPSEFLNWYGNSAYGALRPITNPVVGNHEYDVAGAPGYFGYWQSPPHYYSFTAGAWKVIALDSTSQFNQTAAGSAQYVWLASQLSAAPPCTLVYFHHPAFSVGPQGGDPRMTPIWQLLADSGVDLVLTGHDHSYQRWNPLDRNGQPSATEVTEFVVGSGGHGIQAFVRTDSRLAAGFDSSPAAFGALRLTLNQNGAGFAFTDVQGNALDYGSVPCSGAPVDVQPPTTITDLSATSPLGSVKLQWSPAQDNTGVARYDISRNGSLLASAGGTAYTDSAVVPGTTYTYRVVARDAAGNASVPSNTASATTPSGNAFLFVDTFETGTMASWARVTSVQAASGIGMTGSFGAHAVANNGSAWADTPLPQSQTDLYYRVRFNLVSTSAGANTYLARLRTSTLASIIGVYVSSTGKLAYRNDVAAAAVVSAVSVSTGAWHEVQLHVKIAGTSGQTEVWFDGARVDALSRTENLGTVAAGRLQIGDNAAARTFDLVIDDVAAALSFIGAAPPPPPPPDTAPPSSPGNLTATAVGPNQVNLGWQAATDNVAVTGYEIYRGVVGVPDQSLMLVDTVAGTITAYSDTVAPATNYQYQVRARDAASNVSAASNTASVTTPPLPTSGTSTFPAVADSYVDASKPTNNYGSAASLRFDGSPVVVSYLRFAVSGVVGTVTHVALRFYATSSNAAGCNISPVADTTWGEKTINSTNAPVRGATVAACGGVSTGTWKEIDLTGSGLVTGNGLFSFAITANSSTATSVSSRETSNGPQLVVTFSP
jgi:chitodextrinase